MLAFAEDDDTTVRPCVRRSGKKRSMT